MANMRQAGTDKGERHETGEKEPKGAARADTKGERKERVVAGVGMGKADGVGRREASEVGKHEGLVGDCVGHKGNSVVYSHERTPHEQDE